MLTGLLHRAVGGSHDQDSAVHLSSAGDHVLNIVGVAGAVHVGIVSFLGLVLNVSGVDCDTAGLLFGSIVDLVISHELVLAVTESKGLGDRSGQGGLAVVDVTDGTNVHMGLGTLKLLLCHLDKSS